MFYKLIKTVKSPIFIQFMLLLNHTIQEGPNNPLLFQHLADFNHKAEHESAFCSRTLQQGQEFYHVLP